MTTYNTYARKCPKCGEVVNVEYHETIDATLQPELKEKILNGTFYDSVCENCGEVIFDCYPILYTDSKNKVAIFTGVYDEVIDKIECAKRHPKLQKENSKYKLYGATSYTRLRTIIASIDLGLNPIFVQYTLSKMVLNELEETMKKSSSEVDDGKLILERGIGKIDGKYVYILVTEERDVLYSDFNIEEFEFSYIYSVHSEEAKNLRLIYPHIFSIENFSSYMEIKDSDESLFKEKDGDFCTIDFGEYKGIKICYMPHYLRTKIKVGDFVTLEDKNGFYHGRVARLFKANTEGFLYPNMMFIVCKSNYKPLITSLDSDADLSKIDRVERAKQLENEEKNIAWAFDNVDVILTSEVETKQTYDEIMDMVERFHKGEEVKFNLKSLKIKPEYRFHNPDNFDSLTAIAIYSKHSEVKSKNMSIAIYKFIDICKLLLMGFDVDGFILNPDTDSIFISSSSIRKYLYEQIMQDHFKMKTILPVLSKDEIEFIGEYRYNIIYDVYFKGLPLSDLAKEKGMSKEELGDIIDAGYIRLSKIVLANYLDYDFKVEED